MTYKELKQKLFDAAQILMELYQDIAARAEPFTLTCNSELKKMPRTTSWRFRGIELLRLLNLLKLKKKATALMHRRRKMGACYISLKRRLTKCPKNSENNLISTDAG